MHVNLNSVTLHTAELTTETSPQMVFDVAAYSSWTRKIALDPMYVKGVMPYSYQPHSGGPTIYAITSFEILID